MKEYNMTCLHLTLNVISNSSCISRATFNPVLVDSIRTCSLARSHRKASSPPTDASNTISAD